MVTKTDYNKPHVYKEYLGMTKMGWSICRFCGMPRADVLHYTPPPITEIPAPKKTYEEMVLGIGAKKVATNDKGIFLPRGAIFRKEGSYAIEYLVETPPAIVSLTFHQDFHAPLGKKTADVCVPWTYYYITATRSRTEDYLQKTMVYIAGEPLILWAADRVRDLKSIVYPARLPNVDYNRGSLCVGYTREEKRNPLEAVEDYVRDFYNTVFNDHRGSGRMPTGNHYMTLANLKIWEEQTKKNAFAWMDWELPIQQRPLEKFINWDKE